MNLTETYKKVFLPALISLLISCNQTKDSRDSHWIDPITKMEFVYIPKGKFTMGSTTVNKNPDSPYTKPHEVRLEKGFWMGVTEVTQQQWQEIMGTEEIHPDKPSPFRNLHQRYPVVSVSFYDVQSFIEKLNARSNDVIFRLPTEAEWEYACKAKTTTAYHFGDSISDELANYNAQIKFKKSTLGNFIGQPTPVASYAPNAWGLYDMHGNVWEWVSNWYAPYSAENEKNLTGPPTGALKIIRGGSWYFGAENAQSHFRRTHEPNLWGFSIGFRLVREE